MPEHCLIQFNKQTHLMQLSPVLLAILFKDLVSKKKKKKEIISFLSHSPTKTPEMVGMLMRNLLRCHDNFGRGKISLPEQVCWRETERERGAISRGSFLLPSDFMLKVGRNHCLWTQQPSLLPYARKHTDYR